MHRTAKIAVGLSAAVVAGLVVVAVAPAIGGFVHPPPVDAAAPAVEASANTATPTPDADPLGAPAGYVDIGHGTSIPAGGPGECEASAYIWIGSDADEPVRVEMVGADLVDTGAREFATGEVQVDDQGRPASYTVAPGDVTSVIGDRFCIYNGMALEMLNGYPGGDAIQPGDVLTLNADLVTDWVNPFGE